VSGGGRPPLPSQGRKKGGKHGLLILHRTKGGRGFQVTASSSSDGWEKGGRRRPESRISFFSRLKCWNGAIVTLGKKKNSKSKGIPPKRGGSIQFCLFSHSKKERGGGKPPLKERERVPVRTHVFRSTSSLLGEGEKGKKAQSEVYESASLHWHRMKKKNKRSSRHSRRARSSPYFFVSSFGGKTRSFLFWEGASFGEICVPPLIHFTESEGGRKKEKLGLLGPDIYIRKDTTKVGISLASKKKLETGKRGERFYPCKGEPRLCVLPLEFDDRSGEKRGRRFSLEGSYPERKGR